PARAVGGAGPRGRRRHGSRLAPRRAAHDRLRALAQGLRRCARAVGRRGRAQLHGRVPRRRVHRGHADSALPALTPLAPAARADYARAMATTVGAALRAAAERLATVGYGPTDAEELLSRLLGVGRGELRRMHARAVEGAAGARFETMIARRLDGEPVQYITGRAAFRELDLAVDRRVLIPRPETELLVEAVPRFLA